MLRCILTASLAAHIALVSPPQTKGRRARTGDVHGRHPHSRIRTMPCRHLRHRVRRRSAAARQTGRGRPLQRAAGADRRDAEGRHRRRADSRRRDRDRAARKTGGARRLWLARQGGRRCHDHRHHLQHRLDDQADDGGRRADALRAGQAADRRSAGKIFSEIRRHAGGDTRRRRAGRGIRAGQPQDHHSGPDAAYLRHRLWRARQHAGAQDVSGRQRRRVARLRWRRLHGQAGVAAAAASARHGVGLRFWTRRAGDDHRENQRPVARDNICRPIYGRRSA